MAKRSSTRASKSTDAASSTKAWAMIGWVAGAALWLLVVSAMVSHDPADPLGKDEAGQWVGHDVGVTNDGYANWVGRVGALVSHEFFLVIGPGIWLTLACLGIYLGLIAAGKKITQLVWRAIGVVMVTVTLSAIYGLLLPVIFADHVAGPEGPGGLMATWINDQLAPRFGTFGSTVLLLCACWVGAVLIADKLMLAIPKAIASMLAKSISAATGLKLPSMPKIRGLRFGKRKAQEINVQSDLDDRAKIPVRGKRKRKEQEDYDEEIETDVDAAAQEFEHDQEMLDEEEEEEEQDDSSDAPGAYLENKNDKLSPEAIREKMKQMPINFAPKLGNKKHVQMEMDLSGYQFPSLDILEEPEGDFTSEMEQVVREQAVNLESALQQYGIDGEVVGIDSGPVITLFEVRLAAGTKASKITAVDSDLARALKAHNIRVVANTAGKDTVGIEVPNLKKERVRLKELMTADTESINKMKLPMFLGKDASGNPLIADLNAMPHMLIAGTTGSGKSVCMNSIIMSFLFTRRPDEIKMVLVDPKMVEMSMFKDVPHLMCPVVTEMAKAAAILEWAVTKMDERYELLAELGVRDIGSYNELGEEGLRERLDPISDEEFARTPKKLPYLVFVIDELADLMMTNKEVEHSIVRIAQKARAVGIHLILATQRPQANVVTGLIKSNMPCRIAMKVASGMDSRIVLDQKGGELLLGHGDMLFLSPRSSKLTRAQGTLVDDIEIRRTVKFLKEVAQQNFEPQLVQIRTAEAVDVDEESRSDPLFDKAVEVVLESKRGSVSLLQRRLTIGYARASRIIEAMAAMGILGEHKNAQAREVNLTIEEWHAMKAAAEADQAQTETDAETDPESEEASEFDYEQDEEEYEYEEVEEDGDQGDVPDEFEDEYRQ